MVIRVEKTKNYTVMSNYHLRDMNLSLKAKGLLSLILSLPENWDYSINGLASICKDGNTAIRNALTELEEYGYIHREKVRNELGQIVDYEYVISEMPMNTECEPFVENQHVDNQIAENQIQLNTNKQNKEEKNKDSRVERFLQSYNSICTKLPSVRKTTDKRAKAIIKIVTKFSEEEIDTVLHKSNESSFMTGSNDRGWKADIDFILREDKFVNILEGKYDNKGGNQYRKENVFCEVGVSSQKVTKEEIENGYFTGETY